MLACSSTKKQTTTDEPAALLGPTFSADSALAFCAAQCDFGPRTMNSEAHEKCLDWIAAKFASYGLDVDLQKADLKAWDGTTLRATNIIARHNPQATSRMLICAHWDSRPWADNDPDEANHRTPVMAANDGASGVGVMLELARLLSADSLSGALPYGIDFVCFDAEDYGAPDWSGLTGDTEWTWAMGAQHFAKQLQPTDYTQGILLDMVGGQGAHFYHEYFSKQAAQSLLTDVWAAAHQAGYGSYFPNQDGGGVSDDHRPLIAAGIPTIDIIAYYPDCEQSSFGPTWHTVNDDMNHLDANTLKAVGQTLVQYLFSIK